MADRPSPYPDPDDAPDRPRSLSGVYLTEAADLLHAAGNPKELFRSRIPGRRMRRIDKHHPAMVAALRERVRLCRNGTLFAALAAEAYLNEFFDARLDVDIRKAAIRPMRAPDRWLVGTRLACPDESPLFKRNDEAMPTIEKLIEARNRLAHPRPGYGPPHFMDPLGEYEESFGPAELAKAVVTVSGVALMLIGRAYGKDVVDFPASMLWPGREVVLSYGERAESLPISDGEPEPPLTYQAELKIAEAVSKLRP